MQLQPVDKVEHISTEAFKKNYYNTKKRTLVIKGLEKQWPCSQKWNWDYFINIVGEKEVGVYNNVKSDAYTPINTANAYMKFGDYLKQVKNGPLELRIFLFNNFQHAPQLVNDFEWPEELMKGFVKKYPMLFVGGEGSITHMHYDIVKVGKASQAIALTRQAEGFISRRQDFRFQSLRLHISIFHTLMRLRYCRQMIIEPSGSNVNPVRWNW